MLSSVPSQSTARMARTPGKPYGIQVSACVQATNAAAATAGQITGMAKPEGHTTNARVTAQSRPMAIVP